MPTEVVASDGATYHLWQLPDLSNPNPQDRTSFTTLSNDLGDGYRETRLLGSENGVKEWKITLPTLAGANIPVPTVTGPSGATLTRERYVREVFIENKVTGVPFAFPDPSTGIYYLVDFIDDGLDMQRAKVKLYSTGLTLRQRRMVGITIYDIARLSLGGYVPQSWIAEEDPLDRGDNNNDWVESGDHVTTSQNSHDAWRFNSVSTTGKLSMPANTPTLKEIFMVMKCREATFGQTSGVLTGSAGDQVLVGQSGTNKFTNLSHTNYEYRLNDVLYSDQSNQVAPMQEWGIVHLRFTSGKSIANPQIGQDRGVASTQAEIDVGEVVFWDTLLPLHIKREIYEYLTIKWNIT